MKKKLKTAFISVRLTKELKDKLIIYSIDNDISIASLVIGFINKILKEDGKKT